MMLLAEALTRLLSLWDEGFLEQLPETLLRDHIPVVLIQIFNHTLLTRHPNGSWGLNDSPETPAYAILTLTAVSPLSWFVIHNKEIESAI